MSIVIVSFWSPEAKLYLVSERNRSNPGNLLLKQNTVKDSILLVAYRSLIEVHRHAIYLSCLRAQSNEAEI
jgi:hypothetical protein